LCFDGRYSGPVNGPERRVRLQRDPGHLDRDGYPRFVGGSRRSAGQPGKEDV
jgi:hypothetical protein